MLICRLVTNILASVSLQTAHVRLYKPGEKIIPYQPTSLVFWSANATTKYTPATMRMQSEVLLVELNNIPDISAVTGISVNYPSITGTNALAERVPVSSDPSKPTTTITIKCIDMLYPSAFSDLAVVVAYNDSNGVSQSKNIPIEVELYSIAGQVSAELQKSGIPREFAKLFLPKRKSVMFASLDNWCKYAATLVHASSEDKEPAHTVKVIDENGMDADYRVTPPIHSYQYDTWGGAFEFTNFIDGKSTFDLDRWLKYRTATDRFLTVNCYDQARLLNLVLDLGVPYWLDKATKTTTLGIYYKDRFGYIGETDLVGWGKTNNPFFMGNRDNMILKNDDTTRSYFRNHRWVCVRRAGQVELSLDACAGPYNSLGTFDDYIKVIDLPRTQDMVSKAIEDVVTASAHVPPYTSEWNAWSTWEVTDNTIEKPVFGIATVGEDTNFSYKSVDIDSNVKSFIYNARPSLFTSETGLNLKNKIAAKRFDLDKICDQAFQTLVTTASPASSWSNGMVVEAITPSMTSLVYTIAPASALKTIQPYLVIYIDVANSFPQALGEVEYQLNGMEQFPSHVYAAPSSSAYLGDFNLVSQAGVNQEIAIFGNNVFQLQGSAPSSVFQAFTTAFFGFVAELGLPGVPGVPDANASKPSVTIQVKSPVPVDSQFVVNVTVRTSDRPSSKFSRSRC